MDLISKRKLLLESQVNSKGENQNRYLRSFLRSSKLFVIGKPRGMGHSDIFLCRMYSVVLFAITKFAPLVAKTPKPSRSSCGAFADLSGLACSRLYNMSSMQSWYRGTRRAFPISSARDQLNATSLIYPVSRKEKRKGKEKYLHSCFSTYSCHCTFETLSVFRSHFSILFIIQQTVAGWPLVNL